MTNEELDSQLSAMFDDELPATECELLARRLSRDEALKARWGRYAAIGAAIRSERSLRSSDRIMRGVAAAIATDPAVAKGAASVGRTGSRVLRQWWQPVLGSALAAGVALCAILFLRAQSSDLALVAHTAPLAATGAVGLIRARDSRTTAAGPVVAANASARSRAPDSYVVPANINRHDASYVPPAVLANYVLAHSQFSAPLLRHNALTGLVAAEPATPTTAP
ncbi:MAG TPA: sigma-E factor negative regulatory protein [Steroidobacteraceae bacterium]|nr:sigma-E factor negative regulatory protein [Steroidobacteraceae bacterium]